MIESLAAEHPLREAFRAQLMIALYRAGRQADALRVYRDYRGVLVEELGLDPSPALAELERRVLAHDPTLLLAEPTGLPLRGYRLGERLGTGRDGTVFAARLPDVERDFAIRVFREEIADRPEFVRSFEADAHRVASLRNPAVVADPRLLAGAGGGLPGDATDARRHADAIGWTVARSRTPR